MSKKYGKKCPWKNSNRWKKRRETPKRNPFWQLWSVDKARSMQNLVHFFEDQKHCVMACVFEKWLCLPTAKDSNQFFDHMKYFQRELAPCCSFRPFLNVFKHTYFPWNYKSTSMVMYDLSYEIWFSYYRFIDKSESLQKFNHFVHAEQCAIILSALLLYNYWDLLLFQNERED